MIFVCGCLQSTFSTIFGSPCSQATVTVPSRTIYWTCGLTVEGAFGCQGPLQLTFPCQSILASTNTSPMTFSPTLLHKSCMHRVVHAVVCFMSILKKGCKIRERLFWMLCAGSSGSIFGSGGPGNVRSAVSSSGGGSQTAASTSTSGGGSGFSRTITSSGQHFS